MEKALKITSVGNEEREKKFWLKKSYQERINAVEILRSQFIEFKNADERLQRVCKIINRLQS